MSDDSDEAKIWLVWSVKHRTWWKENRSGYTPDVWWAGRYTRREAEDAARTAGTPLAGELPHAVALLAPEAGQVSFTPDEIRAVPGMMRERIGTAVKNAMRGHADKVAEAAKAADDRPKAGDIVRVPAGVDRVITTAYGVRVEHITDSGVSGPKVRKDGTPIPSRSVLTDGEFITRLVPWEIIPQCTIERAEPGDVNRSGG